MHKEVRSSVRFPLQLPVQVRWKAPGGKYRRAEGKTGNISGNGVFLTLPARIRLATLIVFRVVLPTEITKTPVVLVGQGRVVRRNREPSGVAAVIEDYRLMPLRRKA